MEITAIIALITAAAQAIQNGTALLGKVNNGQPITQSDLDQAKADTQAMLAASDALNVK